MYGRVMFEFESSVLIPLTLRTPGRAELLRTLSGTHKTEVSVSRRQKATYRPPGFAEEVAGKSSNTQWAFRQPSRPLSFGTCALCWPGSLQGLNTHDQVGRLMAKTGPHLEDMIIGFDLPCSDSEYPNQVFLYTNNDDYKLDRK